MNIKINSIIKYFLPGLGVKAVADAKLRGADVVADVVAKPCDEGKLNAGVLDWRVEDAGACYVMVIYSLVMS